MNVGCRPAPIDRGRAQVYAAELAAFDGTDLERIVAFDVLVDLARSITAAEWWPRGAVPVRRARSGAHSSATRDAVRPVIHLAAPQLTRATLVHELAHVLAGVEAGHGELFRRAHVDLAAHAFGPERGGWLAAAYVGAGLSLAVRRWPEPVLGTPSQGAIAL